VTIRKAANDSLYKTARICIYSRDSCESTANRNIIFLLFHFSYCKTPFLSKEESDINDTTFNSQRSTITECAVFKGESRSYLVDVRCHSVAVAFSIDGLVIAHWAQCDCFWS
jgi:hypothetical protein